MLAPDTLGSVDQRAWDGFKTAADSLASQVLANATAKAKVLPCTTDNADLHPAVHHDVRAEGVPPPAHDGRGDAVHEPVHEPRDADRRPGRSIEAVTLIMQGVPDVAVVPHARRRRRRRRPTARNYALNSWEMASRLSYTLWGTMPDDMLFTRRAAEQAADARRTSWRRRSACCRTRRRAPRWPTSTPRYALQGDATRWSEAAHDPTLFPAFKTAMVPTLSRRGGEVLRLHHLRPRRGRSRT